MKPHIAIIGAGVAGLGAARELAKTGHRVTIFEQSETVGGRIASCMGNGAIWDCGAQNIKSQGTAFDEVRRELGDQVIFIDAPVCLHDGDKILPPDAAANAAPKWTCRGGMAQVAQHLARDLDVRFSTRVQRLENFARGTELFAENSLGVFDRVILPIPAPCAAALLATASDEKDAPRLRLLRSVKYRRCLSVALLFDEELEVDWYALLARDRAHPLLWLARENAKGFAPRGTALVAQLGAQISAELWDESDQEIAHRACEWISVLLGESFQAPCFSRVERWRESQPQSIVSFEEINLREAKILLCGDATSAARVSEAYQSGLWAAQRVIEKHA